MIFAPRFTMLTRILPLLLSSAVCGVAATPLALEKGEQFTYRLSWGIFGKAAELTISADAPPAEVGADDRTRITILTSTRGVVRALYPFDGKAESIYETSTGRLLSAAAETMARTKETRATMVLDYDTQKAAYTDHIHPDRSIELALPERNVADFITTLIQTRAWDINLGERREVSVLFDDEFYDLVITAEEEETIKTKWGKTKTLRLVPRMEENPKGMFKKGGEVRVWVSQDERHLPLRFEVKVAVGTAMAVLTDFVEAPAGHGTNVASTDIN